MQRSGEILGLALSLVVPLAGCGEGQGTHTSREIIIYDSPDVAQTVGTLAAGSAVQVECLGDEGAPSMDVVGFSQNGGSTFYARWGLRSGSLTDSNFMPPVEDAPACQPSRG